VLVRGAAGGIGVMAVQFAARGGASAVAVTTSSAERGDRLGALGATHVLDRAGVGGEDAPAGYDVTAGLFAAASRGELRSVIHEVLPLERAVRAHQKMEAGEVFGRIVLEP